MAVGTLVLTPRGHMKLGRVVAAVRQALQIGIVREVQELRALAATIAPSPEEEAALLSRGVAEGAGEVGTPEGGRFIRQGTQVSLQEAILTDRIVQERRADFETAGTGNPTTINPKTGFYWDTRRRGMQGPTEPFNHQYLQAVENGGLVWMVRPRSGTRALEPEPGVLTRLMVKTMPPFQMYRRALFIRRAPAIRQLVAAGRAAAREVGLA